MSFKFFMTIYYSDSCSGPCTAWKIQYKFISEAFIISLPVSLDIFQGLCPMLLFLPAPITGPRCPHKTKWVTPSCTFTLAISATRIFFSPSPAKVPTRLKFYKLGIFFCICENTYVMCAYSVIVMCART